MLVKPNDPATLRQGDIVAKVIVPLPRVEAEPRIAAKYRGGTGDAVQAVPILSEGQRPKFFVEMQSVVSYCAVLSQCCDVNPKQHRPPPTFMLCRVVPVPPGILANPEQFSIVQANVNPFVRQAYLSLFYVGELDGIHMAADFAQVMCVEWRDYATVLRKRVFALDDVSRAKFRVKAGFHLGRPAQEDIDSGLDDPWQEEIAGHSKPPLVARIRRALRILRGAE